MAKKAKKTSKATAAEKAYEQAKKTSKPGEGKRFEALSEALEAKGAKNPKALASWIGRRKYGKERFQAMAAVGRRKKAGKKREK